jgi:DNA-directed RNA polymerase subunit N (RpoN/RPB10)
LNSLSKQSFLKAKELILNSATEPDKAMFLYYFENGSKENVLKAFEVSHRVERYCCRRKMIGSHLRSSNGSSVYVLGNLLL